MKFPLRIWAEQVLFDCKDYHVEADTLEQAVALLRELQEKADSDGQTWSDPRIRSADPYRLNEVGPLDPNEIQSGDTGITLLDDAGERLRDLDGVPTGCTQLGEPLDLGALDERDAFLTAFCNVTPSQGAT